MLGDWVAGAKLTPDQRARLVKDVPELEAILTTPTAADKEDPPAPAMAGLAPDDARRIALDERVRELTLRSLGIGL